MKICIVIPTYNERENILKLIPDINSIFKLHNINGTVLIVDDNSPDKTWEVAKMFEEQKLCKLLLRNSKQGLGSAYRSGFEHALKDGYEVIFEMDADYSHDPKYIPIMLNKIMEGYELVIGSRLDSGGKRVNYPLYRTIISNSANLIARLFMDLPEKDVTSGFRAFKRELLEKIKVEKLKSTGYEFQLEVLFKAHFYNKGKICNIPIVFTQRKHGESKMSFRDVLKFLRLVLVLKHQQKKDLREEGMSC